jgi:hypothetical protein
MVDYLSVSEYDVVGITRRETMTSMTDQDGNTTKKTPVAEKSAEDVAWELLELFPVDRALEMWLAMSDEDRDEAALMLNDLNEVGFRGSIERLVARQ